MKKPLVLGDKGPIVKDAQFNLTHSRWGNFHPGPLDGIFGDQMALAIRRAKFYLGYPDRMIVPVYGNKLHHYLLPKNKDGWNLPVSYRARKATRRKKPGHNFRERVTDYAKWAVAREPSIHYAQVRPIPKSPWGLPLYTDCSGLATLAYKAGGCPDPNGSSYNGSGNTSSLQAHGTHITTSRLRPGDLVFYDHPDHVGIYMGNGYVIEHGSDRGPRWEPTNYRRVTACRSYLP